MKNNTTALIIKDLCQKYPTGPTGRIRKDHYRMKNVWSSLYNRYRDVPVLDGEMFMHPVERNPFYGYDPVDLYKLGIDSMEQAFQAVRAHYRGDSKQTDNRRAKLLLDRVREAVGYVRRNGTTGSWTVKFRSVPWDHPLHGGLRFHASNKAEAESQARFIMPMLGIDPSGAISVEFTAIETREEMNVDNSVTINRVLNNKLEEIRQLERRLQKAKDSVEEFRAEAGKLMGAVMLLESQDEEPATKEAV